MSKRTSKYGMMYDDKRSKANLDKIIFNIKAEVEFNILTGNVLPFKINEEIPTIISLNDTMYIAKELTDCGIIIILSEMIVEELL